MAKNIAMAQGKWERKTANAGDKWKSGVSGKGSEYARGLSEFAGSPVSGRVVSSWEQGVGAVSASDFQSSISGKGNKWAENFRRGIST